MPTGVKTWDINFFRVSSVLDFVLRFHHSQKYMGMGTSAELTPGQECETRAKFQVQEQNLETKTSSLDSNF